MAHYTSEHEKAHKDPTDYLSNPINAYLLVKRLTADWKATEDLIKNDLYEGKIQFNFSTLYSYFVHCS